VRAPLYLNGNIWWCRIRNPAGGRHLRVSTRTRDRRVALEVWRELERGVLTGADPASHVTLADALDERWQERRAAGRALGTLHMLGVKARHLVRVLGGDTLVSRLRAQDVDRYIQVRLDEGAARNTVHKELSTLRGALRLAIRRGELTKPLEALLPHGFSAGYTPRNRALSREEVTMLLRELPPHRAAVVAFILATGATYPSEVAPVRRADITRDHVLLRGTKRSTRYRRVPVLSLTRSWLAMAAPHIPFPPWTNIRRDLHAACARAGIPPCCPTDLRRSIATMLRGLGAEPSQIGAYLGHGDSRMAERVYGRITPEALGSQLEARISRKTGR